MGLDSTSPLKVFISYAHDDQELCKKLEDHLSPLSYSGKITIWQYQSTLPGTNWEDQINAHLNEANMILLLVSPSFIASDYCWNNEVQIALERHKAGTARVIPIILRPVPWQNTPLGQLQALPTGAKPITRWPDQDAALEDVARGIQEILQDRRKTNQSFSNKLREERERRGWSQGELAEKIGVNPITILRWETGKALPNLFYRQALSELFRVDALGFVLASQEERESSAAQKPAPTYEIASTVPQWAVGYYQILGRVFLNLKQYKKALTTYEKGLLIQPNNLALSLGKGEALLGLQQSEEALAVYERVLLLDPNSSAAYKGRGKAYEQRAKQVFDAMKKQAQECHEKARELGTE